MSWPLSGPETISAVIACCGIVLPYLWTHRDARAKAAADRAVTAQAEAMVNKDKEISGWQQTSEGWQQRYEQERREHREDNQRNEDHIARLVESHFSRRDRT